MITKKLKYQFIAAWTALVVVVLAISLMAPIMVYRPDLFHKQESVTEPAQTGTYSIDFTNCKMVTFNPEPGKLTVTCVR